MLEHETLTAEQIESIHKNGYITDELLPVSPNTKKLSDNEKLAEVNAVQTTQETIANVDDNLIVETKPAGEVSLDNDAFTQTDIFEEKSENTFEDTVAFSNEELVSEFNGETPHEETVGEEPEESFEKTYDSTIEEDAITNVVDENLDVAPEDEIKVETYVAENNFIFGNQKPRVLVVDKYASAENDDEADDSEPEVEQVNKLNIMQDFPTYDKTFDTTEYDFLKKDRIRNSDEDLEEPYPSDDEDLNL